VLAQVEENEMNDGYYDPPSDKGDDISWLTDMMAENWLRQYPVDPEFYEGDPDREVNMVLESIALAILDDDDLRQRVVSNLKWIAQGRPKRVNVYEENADLYEEA